MNAKTIAAAQPAISTEHLRLAELIASKIKDGTLFDSGIYRRKELTDVLRCVLAAANMPAPKTFDELPMARGSLSIEERAKWINVLDPLIAYAGCPGDWGYGSKLGLLTSRLLQVRQELAQSPENQGNPA